MLENTEEVKVWRGIAGKRRERKGLKRKGGKCVRSGKTQRKERFGEEREVGNA